MTRAQRSRAEDAVAPSLSEAWINKKAKNVSLLPKEEKQRKGAVDRKTDGVVCARFANSSDQILLVLSPRYSIGLSPHATGYDRASEQYDGARAKRV